MALTVNPSNAQQMANPLSPYQGGWAASLNNLVSNPGSVTSTPGYQFGMDQGAQALQRSMAGTGQIQSGQEQIAMSQYGQQYAGQQYQQQLSNLGNLATGNAPAGANAFQNASTQTLQTLMNALGLGTNLAKGVGNLSNLFSGTTAADTSSGVGAITGTGLDSIGTAGAAADLGGMYAAGATGTEIVAAGSAAGFGLADVLPFLALI